MAAAAARPQRVAFFYDVVSPYSWCVPVAAVGLPSVMLMGFEALMRYRSIWNIDVELCPFFLGGAMHATGNKPPQSLPAKGVYVFKRDLPRQSRLYGVTMDFPTQFPQLTLKSMRILTALKMEGSDKLEAASRSLWQLYWRDQQSLGDDTTLERYLAPVVGATRARALVETDHSRQEVKDELARATRQAVEDFGAFGAPLYVVRGATDADPPVAILFGSDRIEALAMMLGKPYLGANPLRAGL
ncbi:Glutathione S-transferase kappa 1, partial [Cladochytrium tenue]